LLRIHWQFPILPTRAHGTEYKSRFYVERTAGNKIPAARRAHINTPTAIPGGRSHQPNRAVLGELHPRCVIPTFA
jgi:hypothetical protein